MRLKSVFQTMLQIKFPEVFDNETNKFNVSSFLSGLLGGDKENDKEIISELEKWLDDYCKKDDRL